MKDIFAAKGFGKSCGCLLLFSGIFFVFATSRYNRDSGQNKWSLSQQSKQKQHKIKIGIFIAVFRFPNLTLKFTASDKSQSAGEESPLTRDITQLLVQRFV